MAQNPVIVQTTLNPLPSSVNIPASTFKGTFIGKTAINMGDAALGYVLYACSGDLTGDGYPEVMFTGWSYRGWDATGTPPPTPIWLFSTNATGTVQLDPQSVLGASTVGGTTGPRILDLNNDGRNDFFYLGHNESPLVPTISQVFLQNANGQYSNTLLAGPKVFSHNSNIGDFNHDGYVDVIASTYGTEKNHYASFYASGLLPDPTHPDWGYLMLYLNNKDGTFTPYPFVTTDKGFLSNLGSGSASAMGDFNNDGKMEIVIVDSRQGADGWSRAYPWILSNISISNGVAHGDLIPLPTPYFDIGSTYASYPSFMGSQKTHSVKVDVIDVNNDGLLDIVVSSMIWEPTIGTQAGVFQILLNQGNLQFKDVTDQSLYNFFLGAGASHQTQFLDINGDGFPDIIAREAYGQAHPNNDGTYTWSSDDKTWANRILINTGTGKFVQALWNEFRQLTLSERSIANDPTVGQFDNLIAPYLLPDGRFGFIAYQGGFTIVNGYESNTSVFDFRATSKLSTGPNGTNSARQGVPGFSEYFYLTEYPDVATAVGAGQYSSGLAHYLAVGRRKGYEAFAPNATIAGSDQVDTLTLNGRRSNFVISKISGGFQLTDTVGRYGTLKLQSVERVQFTDALVNLSDVALDMFAPSLNLVSGWNLLGNSVNPPLNVATVFGNAGNVTTVWKWIPSTSKWAFYAPTMDASTLAAYAAGKGYDVLTSINGGEGFWVNAKQAATAQLAAGAAITAINFQDQPTPPNKLPSGWSLLAIGDNRNPASFANTIALNPPAAGATVATSLTTLWAWDATLTGWYFFAPSMVNAGTQANYIASKGYLDFGTKALTPTTGFWVNRP